jgi:hypothetical protein
MVGSNGICLNICRADARVEDIAQEFSSAVIPIVVRGNQPFDLLPRHLIMAAYGEVASCRRESSEVAARGIRYALILQNELPWTLRFS